MSDLRSSGGGDKFIGSFTPRQQSETERDYISRLNGYTSKAICQHKGWNWNKHGRCCFNCGEAVVDFGD